MNSTTGKLNFRVHVRADGSAARAGSFQTLHGEALTPVFMPVATFAALRTQDLSTPRSAGFPILLANTYHLLQRPGTEVFERFGGIHPFMNWERAVLTDSGGYQIFSLSKSFTITDDGARFRSYVDGREHILTPELCIKTQRAIGSDIMMVLDQCVPSTSAEDICLDAADRTARWAERSLNALGESPHSLFGIVQGGVFEKLRRMSARQITSLPFDGYAIGGLAVGESDEERKDMTALTAALLPEDRPRYLMGVGMPIDLLEAVHRGVDMFDCIIPTALAEQGTAFTSHGRMELRRSVYKFSDRPLDESCSCGTCRSYSRAYLHHLVKAKQYLSATLIGRHNLVFYKTLMDSMRAHILANTFESFYKTQRDRLDLSDGDNPKTLPQPKSKKDTARLGLYEIIRHEKGFHSVRHTASGEVMHSVTDPLIEARELYYNQSGLDSAMKEHGGPIVIWDVGLGAAANAMTTILELENLHAAGSVRPVKMVSFENDLDPLRLALRNPRVFTHIRHAAPPALVRDGRWISAGGLIDWELYFGDFTHTLADAPAPDIIYFDPFSINTNGPLWTLALFRRIFARCAGRQTRLMTYSVSTRVRSNLFAAGFYVGSGAPAGPKNETTIAFAARDAAVGFRLLDHEWLGRWTRSGSRFDEGLSEEDMQTVIDAVTKHDQFVKRNEQNNYSE